MNERSLLCVLVPAARRPRSAERLREAGCAAPANRGAGGSVAAEVRRWSIVSIGATASRAVLGCMTDAAQQLGRPARGARELAVAGRSAVPRREHLLAYGVPTPGLKALELFGVEGRPVPILRSSRLH